MFWVCLACFYYTHTHIINCCTRCLSYFVVPLIWTIFSHASRDHFITVYYCIILHKWFVTSNLIGWWRSHGCSAFSYIARWIASFWISDVSDVGDVEDVRNGVDCTENMVRTELGADRKWDELAWGEPALGRNVSDTRVLKSCLPQTSRPWKILLTNSGPQRESCTRKPLRWHFDRRFSVTCRPIVQLLSSISSNPTDFSKVRGKHEFLLSLFILFTCALCVCFKLICTLYFSFVFISIWREIYTWMCLKW